MKNASMLNINIKKAHFSPALIIFIDFKQK